MGGADAWEGSHEKNLGTKLSVFLPKQYFSQNLPGSAQKDPQKSIRKGGRKARDRCEKGRDVAASQELLQLVAKGKGIKKKT